MKNPLRHAADTFRRFADSAMSPETAETRHKITIAGTVGSAAVSGTLFGIGFAVHGDIQGLAWLGAEVGTAATVGLTLKALGQKPNPVTEPQQIYPPPSWSHTSNR